MSGKHAFTLMKERGDRQLTDTAIVRLESLCPFPVDELRDTIARYPKATSSFVFEC